MNVLIIAESHEDKLIKLIEPMITLEDRILILLEDKYKAQQKLKNIADKNDLLIDSSILKIANVLLDGILRYEVIVIIDGISFKGEGITVGSAVENAVSPSLPFMRQRSKMIQDSVKSLMA